MSKEITWKSVPKEIEQLKHKVFGPKSSQLNGILSEPYGIHANPSMKYVAKEVYDFDLIVN